MTQIESAHHPVVPAAAQRWQHVLRFGPGLLVALAAAVVTAHGLYEVVHAAKVPAGLAWLYPVITDGLAAVAYRATGRLENPTARRYAWFIVVLAAGVSGLAQASYLAQGSPQASPNLRFLVGAWPAIAAAMVAHLLYLLAETPPPATTDPRTARAGSTGGDADGSLATGAPVASTDRTTGMPSNDSDGEPRTNSDQHDIPGAHVLPREERPTQDDASDDNNAVSGGGGGGDVGGGGGDDDDDDAVRRRWSDTERRAAAVADWTAFLQEYPRAERAEKAEHAARVATRYGASLRWSYYRRNEAEDHRVGPARNRDEGLPSDENPDLDAVDAAAAIDPVSDSTTRFHLGKGNSTHPGQGSGAAGNGDTMPHDEPGPDGASRPAAET